MTEPQTIEELRQRYERMSKQKSQAETELVVAEERLKAARAKAVEEYGTDDLDRLREMLAEWKRENETARRDYQASLDAIEAELERVRLAHEGA